MRAGTMPTRRALRSLAIKRDADPHDRQAVNIFIRGQY